MKKILFIFIFSFLFFHSQGQSYQYYQWHGFNPGIFCDDSSTAQACEVLNFEVDTQRNALWIFGNFEGAGTVNSNFIVGYQNNHFITFPDTFQAYGHSNDYFFYQGNLIGCLEGGVWSYNFTTHQFTTIGLFPSSIYQGGLCLAEYKGDLYVGGQFTAIKGPTGGWVPSFSIARWDGTQWHPLGSGLLGGGPIINDLVVYDNKLAVGGTFTSAGGIDAWGIAQWNDTTWNNMWTGTGGYGINLWNGNFSGAEVKDMELFQNNLYIIGDIDSVCGIPAHLAYWNGVNWTGTSYSLHAKLFKSFLNHLIVFTNENALQIDWWENNQMIPVDSMFDQTYIGAMETFNDTLFISGGFSSSGNTPTFRFARLVYDSTGIGIGISQLTESKEQITVYPNPADEKVFVHNSKNNNQASVQVFNYTGQLIYENKHFNDDAIVTRQLSDGIYLLRYSMANYFSSVKFVVQH